MEGVLIRMVLKTLRPQDLKTSGPYNLITSLIICSFGVLGKPPFPHALCLFEQFLDAPK